MDGLDIIEKRKDKNKKIKGKREDGTLKSGGILRHPAS
jgi:hypothetical protein